MSRGLLVRALALSLALAAASPAWCADAETTALLERARFWESRGRDDLARDEIDKAARRSPDDPQVLLQQGRLQLRGNQDREAAATLERLRRAHPQDPAVAQLATLLRIRGADRERLRLARQLGRAGRNDEAVVAYRAIFPDGFPDDDLALEFAQVLAWTKNGWEPARAQLAELSRRHPDDPRYQVALASHLSTRKPVSPETFRALKELSAVPSVAVSRQAKEAWRRAVLAMDPVEETIPALRDYIEANPGETAVTERLADVTRAVEKDRRERNDPGLRAKREGAAALEAGRLEEAVAQLEEAVARYPNDGEAVGALGIARLRQERHAEAASLLARAATLQPAQKDKWQRLANTARFWALLREAGADRDAGRLEAAEAKVREARALDPAEPQGTIALARILLATGRDKEAEGLVATLTPGQRAGLEGSMRAARAGKLRDEGRRLEAAGERDAAVAALEEAAALEPDDPWSRHDLARIYAGRGEVARGDALFAALLERRPADADTRYAHALYLSSTDRAPEALASLERIAAAQRSANMARLQRRLWVGVQAQRARAFGERGDAAQAARIVAAIREAAAGDAELAPELASLEQALARREARSLRDAGHNAEAAARYRAMLAADPADREAALALADTLMDAGDAAGAHGALDPILAAGKPDARVLGLAGRLAILEGRLDEAVAYEQRSMALAPRDDEGWRYRRVAELLDRQSDWFAGGVDALYRSGTPGKSRLGAQEVPLAWREHWTAQGSWLLRVAPARVKSGLLDTADAYEANTFGSMLLCMPLCANAPLVAVEKGVALGVGYERDLERGSSVRVDLGTSPLGFPVVNAVGGASLKGDLGPFSYTLEAARRSLPSSLLSYAGTRDPNTGRTWGGVVTNGVRLNLSRDSGGEYGAWGVAGLYRLTGRNVQDNDKAELMAGFYRRFVNEDDRQLAAGLTAMLWRFSENAGEFTFGHGGYYSPRSYSSLALPVTWTQRGALTSFYVRASVSVAWSESKRAPFFPTDAALQAQAEALAPVTGLDPFYAGGSNGRSYGRSLASALEHQLAPGVFVGARLEIERSTNYTPSRFMLYVRATPGGVAARPVAMPPEPGLPGFPY